MKKHTRFPFLAIRVAILSLLTPAAVIAEDTPPPPPPGAQQQPPAPPANPDPAQQHQPAPAARKEDEDHVSFMARIKAYASSKTRLAGQNSNLSGEVERLTTTITERDATIATLQAENARLTADLTRIAQWLNEQGIDSRTAAADPAAAFEKAVGAGVAATVRKIGVAAETIQTRPEAANPGTYAKGPDGKPVIPAAGTPEFEPVSHDYWVARGFKLPGLN